MYRKTVFPNGLRVVTHRMKQRESVAVGFLVNVGGRYEPDRVKGAAHFLEHVLFKGSRKYSCDAIKKQIEGVGGSINAFTGEEHTCFYAKTPSQFTAQTLDVLADMVFHPLLAAKDVSKEKTVILEEIKMYHDLPQYFVLELLDGLMWPGHPLGKNLAGTPESVGRMTGRDLRDFHHRYYAPQNIVVAACGNIRHEDFVALVRRKVPGAEKDSREAFIKADNSQERPRAQFASKNIEQMHLALGMLGLDVHHEDKYALSVFNIILGGNMSSRLFDVIREKKGLAYSISSGAKLLSDTGLFLIRAGVDNTKIVKATDLILRELKKIKRLGVGRDEFRRAKDYYLGQVLLGLEDTLDHMIWIADSLTTQNRLLTIHDVRQRVKRITRDDIHRVADQILRPERFNLAVVGPLTETARRQLGSLVRVKAVHRHSRN